MRALRVGACCCACVMVAATKSTRSIERTTHCTSSSCFHVAITVGDRISRVHSLRGPCGLRHAKSPETREVCIFRIRASMLFVPPECNV